MMTGWEAVAGKACQICGDPATHYYGDMLICCGCHVGEKDGGLFTKAEAEEQHRLHGPTATAVRKDG
jgi:hypothetical protein